MIKKTITFTDFNGEEHTEDFYFNLSKAELVKLELSGAGNSFSDQVQNIIKANNGAQIIKAFELILEKSYGVRSEDGARFIKNDQVWSEFVTSNAYTELFSELLVDADSAASFINGIVPDGNAALSTQAARTGQSASDIARARSEASLQGHQSKQKDKDEARGSQIEDVVSDDEKEKRRKALQEQLASLDN